MYLGYGGKATVYCAIEHLAKSIGLRFEKDLMALVTVYFDDSGTHRESAIAVAACFVSDVRRWSVFESGWKGILADAGISDCGFHMADFEAHVPPFDAWEQEKRDRTRQALVNEINKNALGGMVTAVIKNDYDKLVTGRLREKLGKGHYTFAVQGCLALLEEWRRAYTMTEPIQFVFDLMGKGKGEIIKLLDDIGKRQTAMSFGVEPGGYSFQNRRAVVELQSADILAWEANKYMRENQFTGKPSRQSFQSLVDGLEVRARFFDESSLPEIVAKLTARYEALGWDGPLGGFLPQ